MSLSSERASSQKMISNLKLSLLFFSLLIPSGLVAAESLPEIVKRTKPAILEIVAMDEKGSPTKLGTGFFISADGLAVTNFHVISGAASLAAVSNNGSVFIFESLVSHPPNIDLAILKFRANDVPFLKLGESAEKVEGERVIVIGNPTGLTGSVSDGIISAFRENRSLIQITAPISHGSSGSPVLDDSGSVIGVATLIQAEGQNLNFAIAVEEVSAALSSPTPQASNAPPTGASPSEPGGEAVSAPNGVPPAWSDGRTLGHPQHFVKTYVVNVDTSDTLKLRGGPGTRFDALAEIGPDAEDIYAFDQDQVWDGDTWWCPVEWHGIRGYVGRSHLP
jgi:putative serine protease PepD